MDVGDKKISLWKGAELILCADGTYTLQHADTTEEFFDTNTIFLIQCYSNGYINKVPIMSLINLRFNYKYSHGFYPLAAMLATSIASAEDTICVKYMRDGREQNTSIEIHNIRSHNMLGLKGTEIINTSFDKVTAWYLNGNLISEYIEKPIISNKHTVPEDLGADNPNEFSNVSTVDNICCLEEVFREYLKNGRNIPKGQEYAKEVLAHCQTIEDFWNVIRILFKCNIQVYRSPVIDYLNEHDVSKFMPSIETLSSICE